MTREFHHGMFGELVGRPDSRGTAALNESLGDVWGERVEAHHDDATADWITTDANGLGLVFAKLDGSPHRPKRVSARFKRRVARAKVLPGAQAEAAARYAQLLDG